MNHPISLSGRDGLQKVSRPSPAGCRAQTPFSSEPGWIVAGRAMKPGFEQPRHLPYSPNPRRLVGIPLIVTAGSLLTRTAAVVIGFLLCFRQSHVLAETTTVRLDSIGGVDTFVRSSVPTMTNAAEVRLNVGGWGDTYQTFIKFPTSALPAGFTSVKLMLYCQDSNLAGSGTTVSQTLQVPATGWTETITWNTRPSLTALRNLPTPPTVGMWFELDLTSLAQGWKAGSPNNGFTLVPQGTANQWNNYASSRAVDTTKRPFLIFDDANPVMDPTLRAYYPFTGGTGIDASGNNQHAILTDITQITGPNSVSGDAALFNGTSSGAAVSTTIAMTNQQTMAGWFNASVLTGVQPIIAKAVPGFGGEVDCYLDLLPDGRVEWRVNTDNGATGVFVTASSTSMIKLNTWSHAVGVIDQAQNQLRLYINGVRCARFLDQLP